MRYRYGLTPCATRPAFYLKMLKLGHRRQRHNARRRARMQMWPLVPATHDYPRFVQNNRVATTQFRANYVKRIVNDR